MIKKAAKAIHTVHKLSDVWEDMARLNKIEYQIAEELCNESGTKKTAWELVYTLRRIRYVMDIGLELIPYRNRRDVLEEIIKIAELVISRFNGQKEKEKLK